MVVVGISGSLSSSLCNLLFLTCALHHCKSNSCSVCDGAAVARETQMGIRVRGADRQQRGIRVCDEAATTWIHGSTRVVVVASCCFLSF